MVNTNPKKTQEQNLRNRRFKDVFSSERDIWLHVEDNDEGEVISMAEPGQLTSISLENKIVIFSLSHK